MDREQMHECDHHDHPYLRNLESRVMKANVAQLSPQRTSSDNSAPFLTVNTILHSRKQLLNQFVILLLEYMQTSRHAFQQKNHKITSNIEKQFTSRNKNGATNLYRIMKRDICFNVSVNCDKTKRCRYQMYFGNISSE